MDQNLGKVSSYRLHLCNHFLVWIKSYQFNTQKLVDSHGFVSSKCFTLVGGVVIIDWLLTVSLVVKKLVKNTSQLIPSHTTIHYQNINCFY